jgi:RNA recognition motif-containing protein
VKPLTAWQKILKFFGLYKPETSAPRPAKKAARPRKENVRDASGRSSGGDRSRDDGERSRDDGERGRDRGERSRDDGERGRDRGEKTSGGGGKTARARQKPRPTPDSSTVEGTRLYIGNLSYDASEHDLEDLLKGVGSVRNIDIVYNRNTHRSKGYGFVEMGRVDEARRAVEVLHDQPFMGRTLIVNSAKSKGPVDDDGDEAPQESPPASIPVTEE